MEANSILPVPERTRAALRSIVRRAPLQSMGKSMRRRRERQRHSRVSVRMDDLLREYLPILIFLISAIGISVAMVLASYIVAKQKPEQQEVTTPWISAR